MGLSSRRAWHETQSIGDVMQQHPHRNAGVVCRQLARISANPHLSTRYDYQRMYCHMPLKTLFPADGSDSWTQHLPTMPWHSATSCWDSDHAPCYVLEGQSGPTCWKANFSQHLPPRSQPLGKQSVHVEGWLRHMSILVGQKSARPCRGQSFDKKQ